MTIPFVDLKAQYESIRPEIDSAISQVLDETSFIGGDHVKNFEKAFANLLGVKYCVSVANGTDAIFITLKMLGIGPGDEVITSASSWISTSETISLTGAKPVFVDIDPESYTINPELIKHKITKKTKAVIPVHLYGQAAHIHQINALCAQHGLYLIEDCAQAHLTEDAGRIVGTIGIAGTFSFYPGKNLGAYGDAGAIITNDSVLAEKMRMYANHGALKKHLHKMEGLNSRLDSLQAAILNTKLPHLQDWTNKRNKHAGAYIEKLRGLKVIIPKIREKTRHTFHLFVIRSNKRDELKAFLERRGVQTAIHYPTALPNLPAYAYLGHTEDDFPVASKYQRQILSLPMFPELTEEQINFVCRCIMDFEAQIQASLSF